jgi:predicted nucleotidyltransferase
MPYGLTDDTVAAIQAVFAAEAAIEKVVLYGSRAKGTYRPGSDLDMTILESGLSVLDLARIENKLDELLLPYMIDLSLYRQLTHPGLLEHIQRVGVTFYTRSRAAENL